MAAVTVPESKPESLSTTASTTSPSTTLASETGSGYASVVQAEPVQQLVGDPTHSPEFQTFMKEVNNAAKDDEAEPLGSYGAFGS